MHGRPSATNPSHFAAPMASLRAELGSMTPTVSGEKGSDSLRVQSEAVDLKHIIKEGETEGVALTYSNTWFAVALLSIGGNLVGNRSALGRSRLAAVTMNAKDT